jgi:hypothetical protein
MIAWDAYIDIARRIGDAFRGSLAIHMRPAGNGYQR